MTDRETTLYRRAARLRAWGRGRPDQTESGRRRTLRATTLASRLHRHAGHLSTARAIDSLWSALEEIAPDNPAYADIQRAHTTLTDPMPPPHPFEANATGVTARTPRVAACYAIEAALAAEDLPTEVRGDLTTARAAVMRPMRLAIPLTEARAYLQHKFAQAEADWERARDLTPDPRNPEWSRVWTRYAWLHWLELKSLRRAERAGVGAVLALDLDETLLEQLALLGEQLHAQPRIAEPNGTTSVGTVPRDLTADAVEPYWVSATAERWHPYSDRETLAQRVREKREQERAEIERVSQPGHEAKYRELARRQSEGVQPFASNPRMAVRRDPDSPVLDTSHKEIERRFWQLERDLGGTAPIPGFEAAHRHAGEAACHYAAYRQLQDWYGGKTGERAQAFASIRLTKSQEALEQALAAYQSSDVPRDRLAEEMASLARLIA